MEPRTVEEVEGWDSRPFSGGYADLRELADGEFSGTVRANDAWLFMLNGRIVGVFEGDLETFERHDGTVFAAPHPSLPLLFSMRERGGETQAKYYTNDTPLAEADDTLSSANFTGYVELSENVLSGDYYVVYYGGRSMSVAFVGESEQLVSGDDAFERANDEVGIYEVMNVDVDVTDIPEPDGTDSTTESADPPAGAASNAEDRSEAESSTGTAVSESPPAASEAAPDRRDEAAERSASTETETGQRSPSQEGSTADAADVGRSAERTGTSESGPDARTGAEPDTSGDNDDGTTNAAASRSARDETTHDEEEQWRDTIAIPPLNPDRATDSTPASRNARKNAQTSASRSEQADAESTGRSQSTGAGDGGQSEQAASRVRELKAELEEREERIEELREQVTQVQSERDALERERDALEEEIDRLESRLEAESASGGQSSSGSGGRDLSPERALDETNLFVRYDSKGKETLGDAVSGNASRDDVNANLKLEHHVQFDVDSVTVDGRSFEEFLAESVEYQFVSWLVEDLLYEIRETGHQARLKDLFEALPAIDRAELHGTVGVGTDEDETREEAFDVIVRDRMGDPLIVANLNDSRDPATGEMLASLVDAANDVGETAAGLSGAFQVTESFFEPEALETTEEATSAGILSREKRASFVKLSRKQGYHLCLVESRDGEYHVNVPEL